MLYFLIFAVAGIGGLLWFSSSGRSSSNNASQFVDQLSTGTDDDIEQAMWEAGKHQMSKEVEIPLVPKQTVREVRSVQEIQDELKVDRNSAIALAAEEWLYDPYSDFDDSSRINPATGLPMVGGIGGFDIGGNPYGFDDNNLTHIDNSLDLINDDHWTSSSSFDD
jgi:hypothetical protein